MTPSKPNSKYYPDPRVELSIGDDVLGERIQLVITPNGIVVKAEIEGIATEELFFEWDLIDNARKVVNTTLKQ